jgi:hypothetical protein
VCVADGVRLGVFAGVDAAHCGHAGGETGLKDVLHYGVSDDFF